MELHHLHLFNAVATYESFTKASEILHISQSALSIQIKKLEDELSLRLFDKVGNKIALNENGKILFSYTKKIFSLTEEAEHALIEKRSAISGSILIGGSNTPGTYILPRIMGEFKQLYPKVKLDLYIASTDEIALLIEENHLDFAINGGNLTYPSQVAVHKLKDDALIVAASPHASYVTCDCINPQDLMAAQFIVHGVNSQLCKEVEAFISAHHLKGSISMRLGSIDAIKQAVAANLGISLIPFSAVSLELKTNQIKEIKLKNVSYVYPYNLIHHKNRYLSPACLKLMAFIKDFPI
ncbi:MAG: LysR family transcriptional regulator [Cellulosilyticaceae bacterium]